MAEMSVRELEANENTRVAPVLRHVPNVKVWLSLLGPAVRRLLLKKDKNSGAASMRPGHCTFFNWQYGRDNPQLARLYEAAKRDQWNGNDLPWHIEVDPLNPEVPLLNDANLPMAAIPQYRSLSAREQDGQRHAFTSWILSQFLHGEQGALFAACEVTEATHWMDGKLYGSTQVVDEGRHVEVFHRYLSTKLQKIYPINDNLFTIIDALITDTRWDMKFLGMQIMIEGLALGAFGVLRRQTSEPLMREMLKYIITDEARHVHYGVTALGEFYKTLPEKQRQEREDWAYEVAVLMRNRFLAHEFYDEFYGHILPRKQWDKLTLASPYMAQFRDEMFRRLIPNLKRINLLTDRIRPYYQSLGLLRFEREPAAPELTPTDLLDEPASSGRRSA